MEQPPSPRDGHAAIPGEGREPGPAPPASIAASAVLYLLSGLGFGIVGGVYVLPYMIQYRELPIVFGIRALSGGFIEGWGIDALIAAQVLLLVVSVLELVAGPMLWKSRRWGAILAFALFPVSFALGIGLLIPARLILDPLRVALLILGWNTLR